MAREHLEITAYGICDKFGAYVGKQLFFSFGC